MTRFFQLFINVSKNYFPRFAFGLDWPSDQVTFASRKRYSSGRRSVKNKKQWYVNLIFEPLLKKIMNLERICRCCHFLTACSFFGCKLLFSTGQNSRMEKNNFKFRCMILNWNLRTVLVWNPLESNKGSKKM